MGEKAIEKKEKEKSQQLFVLVYSSFIIIFFGLLQFYAIAEVIPLGWCKEPVFWAGAVFWGLFGYFWYDIMCWLRKGHYWLGFALVLTLAVAGYFGFQQFYRWIFWSFSAFGIRALLTVITNMKEEEENKGLIEGTREDAFARLGKHFIKVTKVRWTGWNIQYALFFTEESLVAMKIGGQFSDHYSYWTGVVLDEGLERVTVDKVLALNKDNFGIPYKDISRIEVRKSSAGIMGPRTGVLKIEGKREEEFDIRADQDFNECTKTLKKHLAEKLLVA